MAVGAEPTAVASVPGRLALRLRGVFPAAADATRLESGLATVYRHRRNALEKNRAVMEAKTDEATEENEAFRVRRALAGGDVSVEAVGRIPDLRLHRRLTQATLRASKEARGSEVVVGENSG